jgi:hypothetical protein
VCVFISRTNYNGADEKGQTDRQQQKNGVVGWDSSAKMDENGAGLEEIHNKF